MLAFKSADGRELTVVGMNETSEDVCLNIHVNGLEDCVQQGRVDIYRTSADESCARVAAAAVRSSNYPYTGIDVFAPAHSIFTATNVK